MQKTAEQTGTLDDLNVMRKMKAGGAEQRAGIDEAQHVADDDFDPRAGAMADIRMFYSHLPAHLKSQVYTDLVFLEISDDAQY